MAMDLRHLRYLVAIADQGSFTRAAEALRMAQPPLSQQIARLESDLGVRLFKRSRAGAIPTEAGAQLIERARTILALSEEFRAFAQGLATGNEGSLRLGMAGSLTLLPLIPRAIHAFRQARPGVRVTLEESNTPVLCRALQNGQLDIAIVRPPVPDPNVIVRPLMDEPSMIVLPFSHPLSGQDGIHLRDIAEDQLILFERHLGPGYYDTIIAACLIEGFSPLLGQAAPQIAATVPMVATGMGVAIVPAYLRQIRTEGVTFHPILGTVPRASIAMAMANRAPNGILRGFADILRGLCMDAAPGRPVRD